MDQSSNGTISTYNKLDSKEREAIALLKGTPIMETMIKAIDLYQKDKAAFSMAMSPNWEHVLQTRGEIMGARMIVDLVNFTAKKKEDAIKASKAIQEMEEKAE